MAVYGAGKEQNSRAVVLFGSMRPRPRSFSAAAIVIMAKATMKAMTIKSTVQAVAAPITITNATTMALASTLPVPSTPTNIPASGRRKSMLTSALDFQGGIGVT